MPRKEAVDLCAAGAPTSPERNFIVAEITKTWEQGCFPRRLISEDFDTVVNVNDGRGYDLLQFSHSSIISGDGKQQQETIVAVFRRRAADAS